MIHEPLVWFTRDTSNPHHPRLTAVWHGDRAREAYATKCFMNEAFPQLTVGDYWIVGGLVMQITGEAPPDYFTIRYVWGKYHAT